MTSQRHDIAILLAISANLALSILSASIKWLTLAGYPTFQIIFVNSCISFTALTAWLSVKGCLPKLKTREPLMLAYIAVSAGACFCMFRAFGTGKIAEVSTVVASGPLVVAVLSYFFLHERLSHRQILLVVAGFLGVLLVLKPRPALGDDGPLVIAMLATVLFACSQVLVKKMTGKVYTLTFTFYFYGALILLSGFSMQAVPVTTSALPVFLLSGACDVGALVLLYTAYRHAPASLISPFSYSAILWTTVFGYVVWAETIDGWTVAGAAFIVTAGIFFTRSMLKTKEKPSSIL